MTDGIYPNVVGGMQKHSFNLIKGLAKNNIFIEVFHYTQNGEKPNYEEFTNEELKNIRFHVIDYPKLRYFPGHYLIGRLIYSKRITGYLKLNGIEGDLIYAKGFSSLSLVKRSLRTELSIPIFVNFHGFEPFQHQTSLFGRLKSLPLRWAIRVVLRGTDHVVSYGGKISDIIKDLGYKDKIVEIPSAIFSNSIISKTDVYHSKSLKLVFVGRNERRKGLPELMRALNKFNGSSIDVHFVGPFQELIVKNPLVNVVQHGLIKNQAELFEVLDACDILLCPSYSEGMPNVIMEGMARGLAIIATDVGAVSLLVNGSNGFLLGGVDIETELLSALEALDKMSEAAILKLKIASLKRIKFFTWERVILKTMDKLSKSIVYTE